MRKSTLFSSIKTFFPRLFTKRGIKMCADKNWQQLACDITPALSLDKHKGEAGRIGVIGGCREYTGAPYFAGISALKVGADLSHVFCTSDSSAVIKSYSPELIVHPLLDSPNAVEEFSEWLPRLHSLVIGPGLGRSPATLATVKSIMIQAMKQDKTLVIDADGVFLLTMDPGIIRHYKKAILTPNAVEFGRLYQTVTGKTVDSTIQGEHHVKELCQMLGNVTVVRKGPVDIISNWETVAICDQVGSGRRCGGQGDLLSGAMGTFAHWAWTYQSSRKLDADASIVAAWAACALTRMCNRAAYAKKGRSMTTSDMIEEIHSSFFQLHQGIDSSL